MKSIVLFLTTLLTASYGFTATCTVQTGTGGSITSAKIFPMTEVKDF